MTIPVATDLLGPVQAALYARMAADATLLGMLGRRDGPKPLTGIYDDVPQGPLYPYVVLGEAVETPDNAHGELGGQTLATLHVWDKARGNKTAQTVAGRLKALFDHQPLDVAGHAVIAVRLEQILTSGDPNPELRHLVVRIRITTEQE